MGAIPSCLEPGPGPGVTRTGEQWPRAKRLIKGWVEGMGAGLQVSCLLSLKIS